MTEAAPIAISSLDDSVELARAELYGLLSRLWLAPPDAELLQQFSVAVTQAPEPGGLLEGPWMELVGALRATTPEDAAAEYAALFLAIGKPDIFTYASFYLAGFINEKPLATLRGDLAALGLTRDEQSHDTEDHIAYVLEVMRYLIAGDDVAVCNLEQQRRFFRAHVQTWVAQLCTTVRAHPRARTWAAVADFTQAFLDVEVQGFDMLEV